MRCPLRGVATSERTLAGDPPGSHAPATMAAEPPAQGGIRILGVAVLRLPRRADPNVHDVVTNWNDLDKIQHHSFCNELRVTPEGHPFLPTEANRERRLRPGLRRSTWPATYVATQAACVYSFTATAEREISQDVKENLSYFSLDYDTVHTSIAEFDKKKTYELPDRSVISVGAGRFRCVEVLFQQYIMKCDVYIRKDLYANVVLSGGTAIFQRIVERMTNKLTALTPSTMRSRTSPRRKHRHCRR